jgi:AmmeMemoRadiSam system protein B
MMLLTRAVGRPMLRAVMSVLPSSRPTRPAAVAGRFYPSQTSVLREEVGRFLTQAHKTNLGFPKAVIAPHAGYPYSGPIAGSAFAPWSTTPAPIRRVLLIGPSHYENFRGLAVSSAPAFATPSGKVPVDRTAVDELLRRGLAEVNDGAHAPEHALEVELPFLQAQLGDFALVPLLVGHATGEQVGEVLDVLWGDDETGVVISSDLSHYLDYDSAREVDDETRGAVERLDPDPIDSHHACGCLAIQGLLHVARSRDLSATTVDLRNSGDTAGARDQVVGYGAWTFSETASPGDSGAGS